MSARGWSSVCCFPPQRPPELQGWVHRARGRASRWASHPVAGSAGCRVCAAHSGLLGRCPSGWSLGGVAPDISLLWLKESGGLFTSSSFMQDGNLTVLGSLLRFVLTCDRMVLTDEGFHCVLVSQISCLGQCLLVIFQWLIFFPRRLLLIPSLLSCGP